MAEIDELVDQAREADELAGRKLRLRFLATWMAMALLALLTGIALWTSNNASDDAKLASQLATKKSDDVVAYLRGEQGIPGVPGSNGENGTPGLPGGAGEQGPEGPAGPPGPRGGAGPDGPIGPQGQAGLAGDPGATGNTGTTGAPGKAGEQGTKGETGAQGETGSRGSQGAPGTAGAQGPPGQAGPAGAQGPPGLSQLTAAFQQGPTSPSNTKAVSAPCPAGSSVVSGGFAIQGPSSVHVTVESTQNNGWSVQATNTAVTPSDWSLSVFSLCALTTTVQAS